MGQGLGRLSLSYAIRHVQRSPSGLRPALCYSWRALYMTLQPCRWPRVFLTHLL